mmetsp:Transcript_23914/g.39424  ORF Transcript_23914/g.39424 Transcript_23914/m.39424 type:complete len:372 (-) Transcript_23914:79-1194(-)
MSGEDNNHDGSVPSNKREGDDELEWQEKKQLKIEDTEKWVFHQQTKHMFQKILAQPDMLKWNELAHVRQFCATVLHNPDKYHLDIGDSRMIIQPSTADAEGEAVIALTEGYIECVARREDTSSLASEPILQVVSRETKYRNNVNITTDKHGSYSVQMQFTHLTLCDGDGNIIVGRVVAHLTHEARKLEPGDIIQLPLFTELTHRMGTSKAMPALFIANFRKIGYSELPENVKTEPITCDETNQSTNATDESTAGDQQCNLQKDVSNAKCVYGKRLCSIHGVEMIGCICELHPVKRLNLQTLKEDCYFAKDEVKDMTNSQKRCMIYWWYATNIYSICGKRNRLQLPDCLVNAVRTAYPEADGNYEGFCFINE